MNLYYFNQKVDALRCHARESMSARWRLGELLHEAEMKGFHVEIDKKSGHITVTKQKGGA